MRSNSLFVSGPVEDVNNVEKFLQILDAEDLPGTSRDRVPRTIEVQYADVEDVAATIRDLYKDYLEDPRRNQQQRGGGGNPFAAMMGGGGSSQSGGKSPGIRLTLHTDTRTNSLLLSCDEPTFREIEELVFQRDLAAYKARRTVKVVTLDHANSVVIQQALSALIPKVNVSSSGTSSSRSRTSSQPGGSSGSSADAERQRRIAEFMRMRSGGGSGGGILVDLVV